MFNRKYVFETKSTRLKRLFLSGVAFSLGFICLLATFITYIPILAKMERDKASGAFFQKSPDMIAVFTGDKGRIKYALEFLKKNPTTKLLISGVYANNSIETLIQKQTIEERDRDLIAMNVDLDYESKNTYQNVKETVEFIQNNPMIQNVLIISSDYHILRIKMIFNHLIDSPKLNFYFDGLQLEYTNWENVRKLLKETAKIFRTFIYLKIIKDNSFSE